MITSTSRIPNRTLHQHRPGLGTAKILAVPMDVSASEAISAVKHQSHPEQSIVIISETPRKQTFRRKKHMCRDEDSSLGAFPLAATPSILLNVLSNYCLDAEALARLEATCTFFRRPANFYPEADLSLPEVAAFDICNKRVTFKPMTAKELEDLMQRCGGSWKLVLRFILAGEASTRREKALAVAGPGHSIVVTRNGDAYSFGSNKSGELGIGTTDDIAQPCPIRSLQGIRIIQASAALGRTFLISDAGRVYASGKQAPGDLEPADGINNVSTPQLVEALKDIFVVQAAFGNFFTAFLSREGRVYTVSWGKDSKLGHNTDLEDSELQPLLGALENVPVVQIAAGYCYLLALACEPSGMSVYSVGCGLGGKLGHGTTNEETHPRRIEEFQTLNFQPKMIAAGTWHCLALGADGRVCTWGWGSHGCLGHGDLECQSSPKVVQALTNIKAAHVAAGYYTTFVLSEDGDLYSFGFGMSSSIGHRAADHPQGLLQRDIFSPKLVTSLQNLNERIVHISVTNSANWNAHTFALAESGKLYAFGFGDAGQLGVKLDPLFPTRFSPELVDIDLS